MVKKVLKIILIIIGFIAFVGALVLLTKLNIIPAPLIAGFSIDIFLMFGLSVVLIFKQKKILKIIGYVLNILLLAGFIAAIMYEFSTLKFFNNFEEKKYKNETYLVLTQSASPYASLEDIEEDSDIASERAESSPGLKIFLEELEKTTKEYLNAENMLDDLLENKIAAFVIEEAKYEIFKEERPEITEQLKIIYSKDIQIESESVGEAVLDITKDPFIAYISGTDTYGEITKVGRSDVNIVAVVNPKNKQILLISIPRDYYVELGTFGGKDKLTHAGIYGIETSVRTIERLLDIKINYYVKVNFSTLVKAVDALGGIEIDSPYTFTSRDGYRYKKGLNKLNGEKTLSFVRERKAFKEGDRIRGQNQELVLTALINKAISPEIITNYTKLLASVKDRFNTNISEEDIEKLIKAQIDNPSAWSFESISLDGTDSMNYTYSYGKEKLYVMEPVLESIENAKTKIIELLN